MFHVQVAFSACPRAWKASASSLVSWHADASLGSSKKSIGMTVEAIENTPKNICPSRRVSAILCAIVIRLEQVLITNY